MFSLTWFQETNCIYYQLIAHMNIIVCCYHSTVQSCTCFSYP